MLYMFVAGSVYVYEGFRKKPLFHGRAQYSQKVKFPKEIRLQN
jgi:hypothetical protein